MADVNILDQAVREVTTPRLRDMMESACLLYPHRVSLIRARYREIVAEGGYMLPQEVHDLDAGPSRIIQRS